MSQNLEMKGVTSEVLLDVFLNNTENITYYFDYEHIL